MANLTPASAAAIARLRAYASPPTQYYNLPLSRRAAVLILLFPDQKGELKVVLTMRASTLKSYAGQVALPGGKADTPSETPFVTARREAEEEIGLPISDSKLPFPYRVEHLTELPANLAKTELGVRPCVALLTPTRSPSTELEKKLAETQNAQGGQLPDLETTLIPRLDAKEVAAVFSAPFHHFLKSSLESGSYSSTNAESAAGTKDRTGPGVEAAGFPSEWYKGVWTDWHETRWRMHNFYVPVNPSTVALPRARRRDTVTSPYPVEKEADPSQIPDRFRVFGMTARILVDAARVAYGKEPEFEHNSHFGDEEMIGKLLKIGRLSSERKPGQELTKDVLKQAASAKM